ncbi:MAG: hypothetical protein II977_05315 [Oscillospiraceae bacterium]|nr:hypothetical protein [Oscillospiraceae bacterium]
MKKIYLDEEYRCHITDDGTMTAVETEVFDGKCNAYIEGFRFVPRGESWKRSDGRVFAGEMIAPHMDIGMLKAVQAVYEQLSSDITDTQLAVAEIYESGVE